MFGTLRKHSTWLWAVIIVGTIISFVYFFSPDAKYHFLGRRRDLGFHINNRPITGVEFQDAATEARIRYFFRYGTFPDREDALARQNFDVEAEANNRLLMIEQLRAMNIEPGIDATVQFRDELLTLATGGRASSPQAALTAFDEQVLRKNGLTMRDFERFVRHEVGIMHLVSLAGVAGQLVTPQEAEAVYRRSHEEVVAELVYFPASNFLASVTNLVEANLLQTYSNRLQAYAIPERVQVAYVLFNKTNFYEPADATLGKITNLTQQIDAYYRDKGTNFFKDKDDKVLSEEAAKAKIKSEMRDTEALRLAYKKSYEFVGAFASETNTLADLEALARTNQLAVLTTEPFDREDGPKGLNVPEKFVELAFKLQADNPVCLTPVVGEDGAYVFALKQRLPRQVPAFTDPGVREKVIQDYKQAQAEEMARLAGTIFHNTLTNGLAQKRSFTEICLESKHQPIILPPFAPATSTISNLPPAVSLGEVKRVAFNLTPGSASAYVPVASGGMIVYLRNRFPVDEAKLKAELPAFLANLRQSRQGEAANEWINRQRQTMQVNLPKTKREREAKGE